MVPSYSQPWKLKHRPQAKYDLTLLSLAGSLLFPKTLNSVEILQLPKKS